MQDVEARIDQGIQRLQSQTSIVNPIDLFPYVYEVGDTGRIAAVIPKHLCDIFFGMQSAFTANISLGINYTSKTFERTLRSLKAIKLCIALHTHTGESCNAYIVRSRNALYVHLFSALVDVLYELLDYVHVYKRVNEKLMKILSDCVRNSSAFMAQGVVNIQVLFTFTRDYLSPVFAILEDAATKSNTFSDIHNADLHFKAFIGLRHTVTQFKCFVTTAQGLYSAGNMVERLEKKTGTTSDYEAMYQELLTTIGLDQRMLADSYAAHVCVVCNRSMSTVPYKQMSHMAPVFLPCPKRHILCHKCSNGPAAKLGRCPLATCAQPLEGDLTPVTDHTLAMKLLRATKTTSAQPYGALSHVTPSTSLLHPPREVKSAPTQATMALATPPAPSRGSVANHSPTLAPANTCLSGPTTSSFSEVCKPVALEANPPGDGSVAKVVTTVCGPATPSTSLPRGVTVVATPLSTAASSTEGAGSKGLVARPTSPPIEAQTKPLESANEPVSDSDTAPCKTPDPTIGYKRGGSDEPLTTPVDSTPPMKRLRLEPTMASSAAIQDALLLGKKKSNVSDVPERVRTSVVDECGV